MGLEVNANAASLDIRQIYYFDKKETVKPPVEPPGENLPTEIFRSGNENPNDVYASRTGISTALNPLTLRAAQPTEDVSDAAFDGHFVGADGQTFSPDTRLRDVPAVTPRNGVTNNETLVYVNGIRTDVGGQANSLQAIADNTGSRVIGVHNATSSSVADIFQSLGDKLDIGNNPAVDTLADTVYNELRAGRGVHLLAHSQGAIITSRALQDVKNRLMLEDGMSRTDAENLLDNVRVETFGGASRRFPDGPQYVHYVNRNDGVPQAFGLRSWLNPFAHAGRDAQTHYFREGRPLVSHGFEEFYLPERVPFEQARQGNFGR
ncbi:MAG: hypothetical protein LUM44_04805 [Pyrinomonadaceae bacterium]|nr:hypothetical protein [Pyrinomonadaceae bacterium]